MFLLKGPREALFRMREDPLYRNFLAVKLGVGIGPGANACRVWSEVVSLQTKGQNLVLTVLHVPSSLDSGNIRFMIKPA